MTTENIITYTGTRLSSLFGSLSMREKLVIVILTISCVSILLAELIITGYQLTRFRERLINETLIQTDMLAENATASIAFNDAEDAEKLLSTFKLEPDIAYAAVLKPDLSVFAEYRRAGAQEIKPQIIKNERVKLSAGPLTSHSPIKFDKQVVGYAYVQRDLTDIHDFLRGSLIVIVLSFILIVTVSYILASWMQRLVSKPLHELTRTTDKISKEKDYSLRVQKHTQDELGILTDSFNKMLDQIEEQNISISKKEEQYRMLVETLNEGLMVTAPHGELTYINKRLPEMTGYREEELLGEKVDKFLDERNRGVLHDQLKRRVKGYAETYELEWVCKDGSRIITIISPQPILNEKNEIKGSFAVITDITERKKLEEMMIQSEKMLSVGGLAAGMAHEINNPLAVILQGTQLIMAKLEAYSDPSKNSSQQTSPIPLNEQMKAMRIDSTLENMRLAAIRASEIVRNMLSFSRKGGAVKKSCSINDLLERTIKLAASDFNLKENYDFLQIDIRKDYYQELPEIECEEIKIQQVFLNLLKNGAQAMLPVNPGEPTPYFAIATETEGKYVVIRIRDNGPGMSEEVRRRVFEPFFTTKDVGKGTGLGLSVSYFIITQDHNGFMTVDSRQNRGTEFIIRLPVGN